MIKAVKRALQAWDTTVHDKSRDGQLAEAMEALRAAVEQAEEQEQTESVLIDGTAYTTPTPVACELLRLHIDLQQAQQAKEQEPVAWLLSGTEERPFLTRRHAESHQQFLRDGEGITYPIRALYTHPAPAPAQPVPRDGWLQEGGLLYRLTDSKTPENRDEINVTMADGSRSPEGRTRRAGELLDRIRATAQAQPAPPECQTEAEKTAYCFGWFKALEAQRKAQPAQPISDVTEAVTKTAIGVEKLLCEKLGKAWQPVGVSIRTLVDELADRTAQPAIKPLTGEKLRDITRSFKGNTQRRLSDHWDEIVDFAREVEAAHGIKEQA